MAESKATDPRRASRPCSARGPDLWPQAASKLAGAAAPGPDRGGNGRTRSGGARADGGSPLFRSPSSRSTTWSSRRARSRCDELRARTPPTRAEDPELLTKRVNVGIAVAADDSTDRPDRVRRRPQVAARPSPPRARTLAERVRSRLITPAELSGATFTVSNLGMYGVVSYRGDHQPAAGRDPRGRGASARSPESSPDGNSLLPGSRPWALVLTCDHRILYGAPAAEFLARVRLLLEQPLSLLV